MGSDDEGAYGDKKSPEDKTVAPEDWPSHAEAPGYVPSLPKKKALESERDYAPKDSLRPVPKDTWLTSTDSKAATKVRIISENLKYLEEKIPKDGLGRNEIVYALAQSMGIEGDSGKSNYTKINIEGVGQTTIRISNHSAKTENFGMTGNNVGIVIKTSSHRFRAEEGTDYVELMYYGDKVAGNAEVQKRIASGLRHYIETGDFGRLPEPDRLNTSGAYREAMDGLDERILFRDGDLGLDEAITKMKADAAAATGAGFKEKQEAMKAIGGNLSKLRQAMARQREYDITTVKSAIMSYVMCCG